MRSAAALLAAALAACGGGSSLRGPRYDALLTRDAWGVPHLAGRNPADVAYALGQAQCEDRLEDLRRALHAGAGRLSELAGDDGLDSDLLARAFRHRAVAERDWPSLPLAVQQVVEAFVRGVNDWIREHPAAVPEPGRPYDAIDVVAAQRRFLLAPEIERARAEAEGRPVPLARANAWVLNPARSATGRPALLLEPAVAPARPYEAHLRGGDLDVWGFMNVGVPFVHAGATPAAAFALVPGGADTADAFQLRLDPVDFDEYEWEGRFVRMELLRVSVAVLRNGRRVAVEERLRSTRHGPVHVAPDGRVFALRCGNADHARSFEVLWRLNLARGAADVRAALALPLLGGLDAVWASLDGRIGWVRLGRVPERGPGHDWSRPVPGWTPLAFSDAVVPTAHLLRVEDPPAGFVQACGTSPELAAPGPRFRPEDLPPGAPGETSPSPRALRAVELLSGSGTIDLAIARSIAFDARLPGAEGWRGLLLSAVAAAGEPPELREAAALLRDWDLAAGRASAAATLYLAWRAAALRRRDGPLARDSAASSDTPETRREALELLREALEELRRAFGRTAVPWGEAHRLRRGGREWSLDGDEEQTLRGRGPVAFVHLGDPPVVHAVSPGGQSDDPSNPHFADQAPLFSDGRWRPLPWSPAEIFSQRRSERTVSGPR
jgi:acyl-homoserine lactone acylase PvdQ